MAFLGKIFIAGSEHLEGKYRSGITFSLMRKSPVAYTYECEAENRMWQVEFYENSTDVVARTTSMLTLEKLQLLGFNVIQSALDILSVKRILSTNLTSPATWNVGVYCNDKKSVVYVYCLVDFSSPFGAAKRTRASTNGHQHSPLPDPNWNESFRYYRLSQSSTDLYEAYRNLWLAFESLLNSICPKNWGKAKIKPEWLMRILEASNCPEKWIEVKGESEDKWLRRCLKTVNSKTSLAHFTPTGRENPVKYIIKSQYKRIRCKLQHAKFPDATLPHSDLAPVEVNQAYDELIRIWHQIARSYFNVSTGGGITPHEGFEAMMRRVFDEGVAVSYTSDDTPVSKEDTVVSPQGYLVYEFCTAKYNGQVAPGIVRVIANEDTVDLMVHYEKPIYRICTRIKGREKSALIGSAFIEQGLSISGVDGWEYIHDIRLINPSQPSTNFST